jgi:intein/homing endonuclease
VGIRDRLLNVGRNLAGVAGEALMGFSEGSPLMKAEIKPAKGGAVPTDPADEDPKSLFWDPFAIIEQLGYKERPSAITYGTLKSIAFKTPIVHAIIKERQNQIASFAVPSHDRYQLGFRLKLRDSEREPTKQDKKWIQTMEDFMLTTGVTDNPMGREDLESFLKKISWDSLVYDQMAFEVVPNKKGTPAEFYAVDAATIRKADSASTYLNESLDQTIRHVQIYDGMIVSEYNQEELCFGVRNPRTDIRNHGYGTSELEMLINTVTALLWSFEYNQRAFSQGSVHKGILNFKGAIPEKQMRAFRRHWYQMLSGVENCVSGDTVLWTDQGARSIQDVVGSKDEKKIVLWSGDSWVPATAYKTKEKKRLVRTKLSNNVTVETSLDHKFRVIGSDGEPTWKPQSDLEIGDFVLVNERYVGSENPLPSYHGKEVTPELMNVLGWLTGDGYLSFQGRGHQKSNQARWFYHPDKERSILNTHLHVLKEFDDAAHVKEVVLTDEQVDAIKERYGFKSVSKVRLSIDLFSADFAEWLLSLGFTTSQDGKTIPPFVHVLPFKHKAAFLRGLFSADGNCAKNRSPEITISDDRLREQVKLLLLSMGIRTNLSEGKKKLTIDGPDRSYIEKSSILRIRDKDRFFNMIGFIQDHKQPVALKKPNESGKRHLVAHSTVMKYLREVRKANDCNDKALLTKRERMDLNSILSGQDACSLPRLIRFMESAEVEIPKWLEDYHFESVVEIEITDEVVGMYDVEMYDDRHQFAASGVMTHNSWRTPITNAEDLQWHSMHQTNRDMEYNAWMDFLIKITCAMFHMDPLEVNFKYGNAGQRGAMNETSNKEKLTESRERGLRPLLRFVAGCLNKYVIWPTNPNFEFAFVGLDATTRSETADLGTKLVKSTRTVDEIRAEDDLPPLPDGQGEVILDPVWFQAYQNKQAQAQAEEQGFGDEGGEAGFNFEEMLGQMDQGADEEKDQDKGPPPRGPSGNGNGGPPKNGNGGPPKNGKGTPAKTEKRVEPTQKSLQPSNGKRYPFVIDMNI